MIDKRIIQKIAIGGSSLELGETSTTAYRGDRGKTAYDHSQVAHAPSTAEANVNADWNSETGDSQILNKPTIPTALTATEQARLSSVLIFTYNL